ncbi:hypothetical protein ADUPG1_007781 [Aduncisulcus paluster]|uniref:Uncharacterized protein n=1 Tax=Aduncisulcus paluster TaxID=2918883 RepID=A0ABQ5KPJ7_9EUKA|nr:hypothetical protein ADUPG1_007781 [Aduncisulcus paluster]
MNSSSVEPEFVHEGNLFCCPIPCDSPNIICPESSNITAKNETKEEGDEAYNQSSNAQMMMEGGDTSGFFTHISIPFSLPSPIKGAFICLDLFSDYLTPPADLTFTFTSSRDGKTSKKYDFPDFTCKACGWYFLPIDLSCVTFCEITGKGKEKRYFHIKSLVFFREETPEESIVRETEGLLWSEALIVKPQFAKKGYRDSIPISRDDPMLISPLFPMVKGKDDSFYKGSESYDQSSDAQKMLRREDFLPGCVSLSHLSIPFSSPCSLKGAYICVHSHTSSPSLLLTFTVSDGKKTFKKYEFTQPKSEYEWYFLPINLLNVILCEIRGK